MSTFTPPQEALDLMEDTPKKNKAFIFEDVFYVCFEEGAVEAFFCLHGLGFYNHIPKSAFLDNGIVPDEAVEILAAAGRLELVAQILWDDTHMIDTMLSDADDYCIARDIGPEESYKAYRLSI